MPQTKALVRQLGKGGERRITVGGLTQSAVAMCFSAVQRQLPRLLLFVMRDADEAGYLYQDFANILGKDDAMLFPSSYKRAVKFGQRDAANGIMRTEVLTALSRPASLQSAGHCPVVVTYPAAIAELVISQQNLDDSSLSLQKGQHIDITQLVRKLRELEFHEVD